jgi:O-antigen/teichoic acid export membrane protein
MHNLENISFLLKSKIENYFTTGNPRSIKLKINIMMSFIFKGLSIVLSLLMVPITLNYLDPTRYGIWLTISSLTGWIIFLDVGLGQGLRNKYAEAISKGDTESARKYVSTAYAIVTSIISTCFVLFIIISKYINWQSIMNAPEGMSAEINSLMVIVIGLFSFRFVFIIITTILVADQLPAIRELINLLGNVFTLAIVYTLSKTTESSLTYIGMTYSAVPPLILIVVTILLFNTRYKNIVPSIRYVDMKHARDLLSLSSSFFIIQVTMVILYSTDNIIISSLFEPSLVTPYHIASKYFNIIIILFYIVSTPLWSAITEAYAKNDISWIRNTIKKMIYVWLMFVLFAAFLLLISESVYSLWVGDKVEIKKNLSFVMFIFVIVSTWNNIFLSFINGISKIRLQLYSSVLRIIIKIPLSIVLAKYFQLGISGIMIATIFCQLIVSVFAPIQYYKIINKKAFGIWAK